MALRAGELLTPASRKALTAPQAQLDDKAYTLDAIEAHAYGYTWAASAAHPQPSTPGHPGYQSSSAYISDLDTSIVVLLNDDAPNLRQTVNPSTHSPAPS